MSHHSGCTPASFRHLPSASSFHVFSQGVPDEGCPDEVTLLPELSHSCCMDEKGCDLLLGR